MKKRWIGFLPGFVTALVLVGLVGGAVAASYQKQAALDYSGIRIVLDGKEVIPTDANGAIIEPFAIEGTTYLPVRGIANALGLDVAWDGATQTVTLTTPDTTPTVTPTQMPVPSETMGQKNALAKAKSYLSISAFSYDGLVKQLEFEKFSKEDAAYGADHCGADWKEQAAKKAKSYLELTSFSRDGLINQLEFEGFTHDQAVYGAQQNGY